MTKYRVKTKEEFINEFGERWYDPKYRPLGSTCNFVSDMSELLGYEIPSDFYKHLDKNWFHLNSNDIDFRMYVYNPDNRSRWSLSIDMIKEIVDRPNYNEKKTLVYD